MAAHPHIYDLRVESLENPLGLIETQPHLTWKLSGGMQTAYQVQVGSSHGKSDLWDSGKVESFALPYVTYAGAPLASRQKAYWTVTVWGDFGETKSSVGTWEMALLTPEEWQAEWIQSPFVGGPVTTSPAPLLRHDFKLDKPVSHARLYITTLGIYSAEVNGHPIGDEKLAPGWTDYHKRVIYQTYDVGHALKGGDNVLGVVIGDGWYVGHVGWRERQYYGDRPRLLARLEVTHPDGTRSDFVTGNSWKAAAGPILASDLMMGESYDARQEKPGWSSPGANSVSWLPVELPGVQPQVLVGAGLPPIRAKMEIHAISVTEKKGGYVFDMGQNMVGHVRFKLNGTAGQTITLEHAEVLQADGEIYTTNLRKAKAADHYTFAKDGDVVWEPKFTFHGFRYVQISGLKEAPAKEAVTGIVVHSDLRETGDFKCSDPMITQLFKNVRWGWRGNSLSVPTDCPQRDERLGWTGDAQVFSPTANFLTDAKMFYAKYSQDLEDGQRDDGQIPCIAPDIGIDLHEGGPAWADAFMIVPWESYRAYGDTRVLERHYPALQKWVAVQKATSQDLIRSYDGYPGFKGFGDWLNTDEGTDLDLIGTAYFARSTGLMSDIAQVLGKTEDAATYRQLHDEIKASFVRHFIEGGKLKKQTQTGAALCLGFNLVPSEMRQGIGDVLVSEIESRKWHLSTGFVGTPLLMDSLTSLGRVDVAYKLLEQKTWPSWLYPVTKGATTIWERWDGYTDEKGFQDPGMNSFNHYAYGAIGAWLYGTVAGIQLDTPARELKLAPRPGGSLKLASANYDSIYGEIESGWELKGGHFEWHLRVPANVHASAQFPPETSDWKLNGKSCEGFMHLDPGTYKLSAKWG